jgi:hypothetical protein
VVAVVGCLALVAGGVALALASSGDDDDATSESASPAGEAEPAGELAADASPVEAFAHAAAALDEAGTFSYEATSRVEGPDPAGGSATIAFDRDLTGDVVLPDAVRETIDDPDGLYTERISIGTDTALRSWVRDTAYPDQIDERPWGEFDWSAGELELYLLPDWLEGAVDHRDGGEDANGRRVVEASIPTALINDLGPEMVIIDAAVELTLGGEGVPHRVAIDVSTSDTVIKASYRLTDLGDELVVEPPRTDQLDATPWFNEQDLAAFDGPAPLGLSGIPEGWEITAAYVTPDPVSGCPSVTVDYTDPAEPVAEYLWLDVFDAECAFEPSGAPLEAAGFAGAVEDLGDGSRTGVVVSGETAVSFVTDLSVGDLQLVLATLGPLDLTATPRPLAGIPSTGT